MKGLLSGRCCAVALLAVTAAQTLAHECTSEPREDRVGEYAVHDDTGKYVGYVAREKDGTWFVWRDAQGTSNKVYQSKEEAVDVVCHWGSEPSDEH